MSIDYWSDFTTAKSIIWRPTVQIPEQLLKVTRSSPKYLMANGGANPGYVYRRWDTLLTPSEIAEAMQVEPTISQGGRLVQIEALVKGFHPVEELDDKICITWCVPNFHGGKPDHFEFFYLEASEPEVEGWVAQQIGPHVEIGEKELGKWAWGLSRPASAALQQGVESVHEPWTIMFEQQFASFFALVATSLEEKRSQEGIEKIYSGYREWSHICQPLEIQPFVLFSAPLEWYDKAFWKPFFDLDELGGNLFKIWARDLDSWWLDTWRQFGKTICLAPTSGQLRYFDVSGLSQAIDLARETPELGLEVPLLTAANELRDSLLGGTLNPADLEPKEIDSILFSGDFASPISYARFDEALGALLLDIDFFGKLEAYLADRKIGLAMVPLLGRTIWTPTTALNEKAPRLRKL